MRVEEAFNGMRYPFSCVQAANPSKSSLWQIRLSKGHYSNENKFGFLHNN